ncbi:hypothetical protein L288_07675 [Sphingobium quisquiliarum P25]|uniref:UrcA family protein n=1 Tax=Sphingobium quisquiliarum P25 TaxID=1329909 RepID=T0IG00_9SPHN|nr:MULTISPECIES: UrcA family protein [Sphingobium]EQB08569.1 hypothetical protein L288_07675 [Sphingobium quisquiliarum P25]EZP73722.1 putative uncharacterized protein precursor [Sphingomonas paucimobilis]
MTKKTLAALAAAMTFALPASALAGDGMDVIVDGRTGTETRSVIVSLADLDLGSSRDARRADSRINRAAKQVCGWMSGTILQPSREYRACFDDALSGARADLASLAQGQHQG